MKKLLAIAILLSTLFALASCADVQENVQTTTEQTQATTEPQNEVKEYYENGNVKTLTVFDDEGNIVSVNEFWENDYIRSKKTEYKDGKISSISEYNKNALLQSKTEFDDNGNKISIITYSYYNEIGLLQKIEFYDAVNSIKTVDVYEKDGKTLTETLVYNQIGLLTSLQSYKSNGSPSDKLLYYYDENGLNIRTENVSSDGTLLCYGLIEYYPSGNTKTDFSYSADGTLEYRTDYYETGEYLREYVYNHDGVIMRIIEYSVSGNIIRNQDYENGILRVDTIFKDSPSIIEEKCTLYNEDGSLKEYTVYEESGNWMSITKYDAEGNVISVDGYSTASPD